MVQVECNDCGRTWDYTGSGKPRCTNTECRSRDVDEIDDTSDTSNSNDPTNETATDGGPDPDDGDDADGFVPAFERGGDDAGTVDDSGPVRLEEPEIGGGEADDEDADPGGSDGDDGDDGPEPGAEIPEIEPEELKPALELTFSYVANRRGQHWTLRDEEAENLSVAYARVANKYAPYLLQEYTIETYALFATVTVCAPRLKYEQNQDDEEPEEPENENPNPPQADLPGAETDTTDTGNAAPSDEAQTAWSKT